MIYNVLIVEDESLLAITYEMGLKNSERCSPSAIAHSGDDALTRIFHY